MEASWKFSGAVAKANLILASTRILHEAWEFISDCQRTPRPISFAVREFGRFTILAFNSGSRRPDVLPDLELLDEFHPLGFLITNDNPSLALDSFPLSTFRRLLKHPDLTHKLQILTSQNQPRLIVVGHSDGGAVAALFTLWLLKNRSSPALPICITYGSPFIGNEGLQKAIGKIEQWKSQFWHVLAGDDPVISWCRCLPSESDSAKQFKPFGTYLLLSGSGYACIDDPNSVIELLSPISLHPQPPASAQTEPKDYGVMLRQLKQRTKYRKCNVPLTASDDSLTVDLALQFQSLEIGNSQQAPDLLQQMLEKMDKDKRVERTHNSRKLNDMKQKMAQLEWFKKDCQAKGNSYYDVYKRADNYERLETDVQTKIKTPLLEYWKKEVTEAAEKPQTRDAQMRDKTLFGGNNYRRMVEPLQIAEYYKKGGKNYLKQRDLHFVNLEKWEKADAAKEERKKKGAAPGKEKQTENSTAPSLTHDSCFWARVEEAALKLRDLENGGEAEKDIREKLREFEDYVKKLVDNFQLSPDAFCEQSSFMVWWEKYWEMINRKEPHRRQDSPFIAFMSNQGYENYVKSAK